MNELEAVLAEVGLQQPSIAWLQDALNRVLGLRLAVDGVVGPATRAAIRSFQSLQGLAVDGIAGPQTTQRLRAATGSGSGAFSAQSCASIAQPCETLNRFGLDSAAVLPSHQPTLIRIAECLISLGSAAPPVRIVGHTDASGQEVYNAQLGQRRAEAVGGALQAVMDGMRPGSSGAVGLNIVSAGESQSVSSDPALNRRVDVCVSRPTPAPPVIAEQIEIVAKSFIALIGPRIGTTRCAILPGEPTLQAFAAVTDASYHENPLTAAKVKNYRLYSRCTFTVMHQGGTLVRVTPGPLDTDVGFECPPGVVGPSPLCFSPPPMTRVRSSGRPTGASTYDFSWFGAGCPNPTLEPSFQAICPRTSRFIWHRVDGRFDCSSGTCRTVLTLAGSRFPSHRAWVNGVAHRTVAQRDFSSLWVADPVDPSQVR
jgi:outer membrane protein OmpA-like peptidoglycan-associated protein